MGYISLLYLLTYSVHELTSWNLRIYVTLDQILYCGLQEPQIGLFLTLVGLGIRNGPISIRPQLW